jgi:phage shock protein E
MKKFFTLVTLILSIGLIANDYYLIDVRTQEEFKSGYLEDAINIEWQNIKNLSKEIKKDEKIYLYCRSGNRSGKATDILINLGYKNVKNIGGLKEASESLNLRIIK